MFTTAINAGLIFIENMILSCFVHWRNSFPKGLLELFMGNTSGVLMKN